MTKQSQDELERQIEQQREELADTVAALQEKLDVKAQAKRRAEEVRQHPAPLIGVAVAALALTALVVWRRRR
jgi:MYXO-CTERM domain-containing protein